MRRAPQQRTKGALAPGVWSKVGGEFGSWVAWWRESLILPLVYALLVWAVLYALIPAMTGRAAMLDVGILGDQGMRLFGVILVIALVGALKGKRGILPDVDEDLVDLNANTITGQSRDTGAKTIPWQLVAVDVSCTVLLICFLSWLVVGR